MAKRKRPKKAKPTAQVMQQREPLEQQMDRDQREDISVSRSPTPLEIEECPFTIEYRRMPKRNCQASRTTTSPAFFTVQPRRQWHSLKPYKHFSVGRETFGIDDLVFINNAEDDTEGETKFWVARVLEIRALDEAHVYIRVYWWYWPENLPMGRRAWHGNRELIASNHLEVIDAITVSGRADMRRWEELDEEEEGGDLFWRQSFDYLRATLLPIRLHCTCNQPYNPDTAMYFCAECNRWLHHGCVVDDIKKRYSAEGGDNSTTATLRDLDDDTSISLNIMEEGNSTATVVSARNELDMGFATDGTPGSINCTMRIECLCCRGTI